jgi:DNA-binding MarR family transcriptional regulator
VPGPERETTELDVLKIFYERPDPAFVPTEIAEACDCSTETARNRLESLAEAGYLGSKKPGRRSLMYWITPAGYEYYESSVKQDS